MPTAQQFISALIPTRARGAIVTVLLVVLTFGACNLIFFRGGDYKIRYRLTVAVEVDGQVYSGSSIIQAHFYGGGSSMNAYKYYSRVTGVSPAIELGGRGWLVAALRESLDEGYRRRQALGLDCKRPRDADGLLDVFGLDAADIAKLRKGKRELADGYHPPFVWFPSGEPYTSAQQICPEEFARVIRGGAQLRSATIELVPGATVKTRLEFEVPWLSEMRHAYDNRFKSTDPRSDNRRGYRPFPADFERQ